MTADASQEPGLPIQPIIAFVTVWLGGSSLIVGILLNPILPGGSLSVAAFLALAAVPVWVLLRSFGREAYPSALTRVAVFRPFWYAMASMPLLAAAAIVGTIVGLPVGLGRTAGYWAVSLTGGVIAVSALAGFAGSRRLVVKHLTVHLPKLPPTFEGLRVAQLSDLHVGPHTPRRFLERAASAVRGAQPDVIVITGDQVDDFPRDTEPFGAVFRKLTAPAGVFVIPGNHDVYAGWDAVRRGLEALRMTVLVNEAVSLDRDGQRLWIAGTGDPAGKGWARGGGSHAAPDIERTLAAIPDGEPVLALAHNPALWPSLAARGVDLTLSGHTHYGQLAIPRWGWNLAGWFLSLSMGAHRHRDSLLYINPGTNYWALPFRLGTPPEVTILSLATSNPGDGPSIEVVSVRPAR